MNIYRLYEAVRNQPNQASLVVAVRELERQGYRIVIADKHDGSAALEELDAQGELSLITMRNSVRLRIEREGEIQELRLQFLDNDDICLTHPDTPPVIYDPEYTTGFFKSGETN